MTTTISYRLPCAELVVSGTVRRTYDPITDTVPLAERPATLVAHAFAVRHVAGESRSVTLPGGWLRTFKGAFAFTADGRLTSASAESTGQAGAVLSAAATIAGAAVGLHAAGVALGATADPADARYGTDHPDESARRARVTELVKKTREAQLTVVDSVLADPAAADRARWDLLERMHRSLAAELAILDTHRAAWRDGLRQTVDEIFEFTVPLADVKLPEEKAATETSPAAPANLTELWKRHGIGVRAAWAAERGTATVPLTPATSQLVTRVPDLVTLSVVQRVHGVPVVTATSRHLVMDDRSRVAYHPLEKSLFGRRSRSLTFDTDGVLTGLSVEGAAVLAEAATAAGALPAAFAGGLGSANSAVSGLATARRAAQEAELARVKQEVELEQQRITQAGLRATAADAARLQHLKQVRDILETETAIGKADPRLLAATGQAPAS